MRVSSPSSGFPGEAGCDHHAQEFFRGKLRAVLLCCDGNSSSKYSVGFYLSGHSLTSCLMFSILLFLRLLAPVNLQSFNGLISLGLLVAEQILEILALPSFSYGFGTFALTALVPAYQPLSLPPAPTPSTLGCTRVGEHSLQQALLRRMRLCPNLAPKAWCLRGWLGNSRI